MTSTTVTLRCGTLRLSVERADMPLEQLCGYASRRSRKRGFVFVSKVLGKHYPARPALMMETYERLAAKLPDLPGPVVLIALAETATGLGQGIYEAWLRRTGRDDGLFLHTTRYRLRHPLALDFEEAHSHAAEHLVYLPGDAERAALFREARTLVLVDDEITTGRTLANLTDAYQRVNPRLAAAHWMCLTDWLGVDRRAALADRSEVPTTLHCLLQGSFHFEENPAFDPGVIPNAVGGGAFKDAILPRHHGRLGVCGLLTPAWERMAANAPAPGERVLVLGTGEFAYPPFLLARHLEALGCDVHFQSTTRSPLLPDGDLASAIEFRDNYHDGIANYLYNVAGRSYDRILIGYETTPLPDDHRLAGTIGGHSVFF